MWSIPITTIRLRTEHDLAVARAVTRLIAEALGLADDAAGFTAAVWAIAHNALAYGRDARLDFFVVDETLPRQLTARVRDRGPGPRARPDPIDHFAAEGQAGGIQYARRLVDRFRITTDATRGTAVLLAQRLPPERRPDQGEIDRLGGAIAALRSQDLTEEPYGVLRELLLALTERRMLREQIRRLDQGRETAGRQAAVVAEQQRHARALLIALPDYVRHQAGQALNSILMLCRLLVERTDGPLTAEQERQVVFMREACDQLLELITTLCELGRAEFGPDEPQPAEIVLAELYQKVQGHLSASLRRPGVRLIFDQPGAFPTLRTDSAKLTRILVCVVGFALRRTEHGEVRLSAEFLPEQNLFGFTVEHSGAALADDEHRRVFADFLTLLQPPPAERAPLGLALPLARRQLEKLGGRMVLAGREGGGEVIRMILPRS